jgi:nicotinate dehydrogenase subunit A
VQLGGEPIRSCVTPVAAVAGKPITTLEGLGTPAKPHPVQKAFLDAQAAQCGWCTNAQILASASYIQSGVIKTTSSEDEIKSVMNSYLCRCGTHFRILEAIQAAAKAMAK